MNRDGDSPLRAGQETRNLDGNCFKIATVVIYMSYYHAVTPMFLYLYAKGMTYDSIKNDLYVNVCADDGCNTVWYTGANASQPLLKAFLIGTPTATLSKCTSSSYCIKGFNVGYVFDASTMVTKPDPSLNQAYYQVISKTYGRITSSNAIPDTVPIGYATYFESLRRQPVIYESIVDVPNTISVPDNTGSLRTVYIGAETGTEDQNCLCDNACTIYTTTDNPVNNPSFLRFLFSAAISGITNPIVGYKIVFRDDLGNCYLVNSKNSQISMFTTCSSVSWAICFGVAANYYDGSKWWGWVYTTIYLKTDPNQTTPNVVTFIPSGSPVHLPNRPTSPQAGTIFVNRFIWRLYTDVMHLQGQM